MAASDRRGKGGIFCSAFNCSNALYKTSCKGKSFFRFPKDEERCKRWIQNARRQDFLSKPLPTLRNLRLCSDHFEGGQYLLPEKKKLKWDALPTLFTVPRPPSQLTTERPQPAPRCQPPVKQPRSVIPSKTKMGTGGTGCDISKEQEPAIESEGEMDTDDDELWPRIHFEVTEQYAHGSGKAIVTSETTSVESKPASSSTALLSADSHLKLEPQVTDHCSGTTDVNPESELNSGADSKTSHPTEYQYKKQTLEDLSTPRATGKRKRTSKT